MKSILIAIKPKWCAKIMNGEKTIEVRRNKALASAIQKLIDENGYADIYVYCSKINKKHYHLIESIDTDTGKKEYEIDYYIGSEDYLDYCYEGKVAFKFRCYKVEEIKFIMDYNYGGYYNTNSYTNEKCFERDCCLTIKELDNYINKNNLIKRDNVAYAIHISDLEIFDKPKELSEFSGIRPSGLTYMLEKAPQNFCYAEASL